MGKKYARTRMAVSGKDLARSASGPTPWFVFLGAWLCATSVRAETPPDVLVVPMFEDGAHNEAVWKLVDAVDSELGNQQLSHVLPDQMREAFERAHSRDPAELSPEDRERFVSEAHKGLDAVIDADWSLALERLRGAMARATNGLEATNRNQRTSEQLFQACLLTVQVTMESGNRAAARGQALDCIVQSPNMERGATSHAYAPIVEELLLEAQQDLAQQQAGPIGVESAPSGCAVRVNGRRVGVTPFAFQNPARRPYRIQVECDSERAGRVHLVTPTDGPSHLLVDARFEDAVRIDEHGLRLNHPEVSESLAREHARKLLRIFSAARALIVARGRDGRFILQRLGEGEGTAVVLEPKYAPDAVREAVLRLFGPTSTIPEVPSPGQGAVERAWHEPSLGWWQKMLVGSGAVVGTAALGVAYGQHRRQVRAGDRFQGTAAENNDDVVERGNAWADMRAAPFIWAGAGSSVLTAAAIGPLVVAPRALPWWATAVAGTVGTGLVTWGAVELARNAHCGTGATPIQRSCVDEQDRRDRGGLLLLTSVPFMALAAGQVGRAIFATGEGQSGAVVQPRAERRGGGVDLVLRL